jgi:hypothetical protein
VISHLNHTSDTSQIFSHYLAHDVNLLHLGGCWGLTSEDFKTNVGYGSYFVIETYDDNGRPYNLKFFYNFAPDDNGTWNVTEFRPVFCSADYFTINFCFFRYIEKKKNFFFFFFFCCCCISIHLFLFI